MQIDKSIRFNVGYALTLLMVAVPMFGWLWLYDFSQLDSWRSSMIAIAKIGAFGGMAMFAVSLILSGRYVWLDKLFGGLDKVYVSHRFYGTMSTVLLLIHPIGLTLLRPRSFGETIQFWAGAGRMEIIFGSLALYGLIGFVVWSILSRSRYETFVLIHRWLGVIFVLGSVHAFLAGSLLSKGGWLYWYMLLLSVGAGVTFLIYSIMGDLLHKPLKYRLKAIADKGHNVTELILEPKQRHVRFTPGQFVYISFPDLKDKSFHPLSITSGKKESQLRLAVRQVGDFSSDLSKLKPGSAALIKGPYGGFTFLPARRQKQFWIAGGIGVTPFLSGARSLTHSPKHGQIEMIYATDDEPAFGIEELSNMEQINPSFNVTLFNPEKFGYLTLEKLKAQFSDFDERRIYLCGPPAMTTAIFEEAQNLGISHKLHFEEFNY